MELDTEMTAYQLHGILLSKGYRLSLRTILRCRTALGVDILLQFLLAID